MSISDIWRLLSVDDLGIVGRTGVEGRRNGIQAGFSLSLIHI